MRSITVALTAALGSLAVAWTGSAAACESIKIIIDSIQRTGAGSGGAVLHLSGVYNPPSVWIDHSVNSGDPHYNELHLGSDSRCMDISETIVPKGFTFQSNPMSDDNPIDYKKPSVSGGKILNFNYANTAWLTFGLGRETNYSLKLHDGQGDFSIDPKIQNQPPAQMFMYVLDAVLGLSLLGVVATLALNLRTLAKRPRLFGALIATAFLFAGLIAISLRWI